MQRITPFLWFDDQAEEAAAFYVSIFKNARIIKTTRYGKEGFEYHKKPAGSVMTVEFEIEGQRFIALNGGPQFKFSEAISFAVDCRTQEEIDSLWQKLSAYPDSEQCGWLRDKFGLSWQIIPSNMGKLMNDPDPKKSQNVMKALLRMKKLDIEELQRAHEG
jgi:predicted 3-demethylubiquinone-9 3-methyltransferase (glyoxalase superfamily)